MQKLRKFAKRLKMNRHNKGFPEDKKFKMPFSFPPLGNNTNPDDKLEFVLFFSNEYFGIKVDLNGKKKNQPGG